MSKIEVCGHRILVKISEEEVNLNLKPGEIFKDGNIIHAATGMVLERDAKFDKEARAAQQGYVVGMGPEAYDIKSGKWCEIGDRVFFTRYSGKEIKGEWVGEPGVCYIILNDDDILAVIKN